MITIYFDFEGTNKHPWLIAISGVRLPTAHGGGQGSLISSL